jgi:restriction endonuclease Mrr
MIVTTSSFTPAAIQEAEALRFETIDGQQFAALLKTMPSRLQ